MTTEGGLIIPEFKEIPRQFTTVVVDDEPEFAEYTEEALKAALESTTFSPGIISKPLNAMDMFVQAFTANQGNQVDVVLLDHKFRENYV